MCYFGCILFKINSENIRISRKHNVVVVTHVSYLMSDFGALSPHGYYQVALGPKILICGYLAHFRVLRPGFLLFSSVLCVENSSKSSSRAGYSVICYCLLTTSYAGTLLTTCIINYFDYCIGYIKHISVKTTLFTLLYHQETFLLIHSKYFLTFFTHSNLSFFEFSERCFLNDK